MSNQSFPGPPHGDVSGSFSSGNSVTVNSLFGPPQPGFDPFVEIGSNRPDATEMPLQKSQEQHNPSSSEEPVKSELPPFPSFSPSVPPPSTVSSAAGLFGGRSETDDFFSSLQPQNSSTSLATKDVVPNSNPYQPQEQLDGVQTLSDQLSVVPQPSSLVGLADTLHRNGSQPSEASSCGPLSLPVGLPSSVGGEQLSSQGSPVKFSSAPSTQLIGVVDESGSKQQNKVTDHLHGNQLYEADTRLDSQMGVGVIAGDGTSSEETASQNISNASSALPSPMARQLSNAYGDTGTVPLTDLAFMSKTNADPEYSGVGARSSSKRPLSNLEFNLDPPPKYLSSNLTDAEKFSSRNMSTQPIGGNNPLDRNAVSTSTSSMEVERASSLSSSHNQSSLCSLLDNQEDFPFRSSPIRLLAPAPFEALTSQNPPLSVEAVRRPDGSSNAPSVPPLTLPSRVDSWKATQTVGTTGNRPEQNHAVASGSVVSHSAEVVLGHHQAQDLPLPVSQSSSSVMQERLQDAMVSQEDSGRLPMVDGIQHAVVSQSTESLGGQGPKPQGKTPGSSRGGSERPDSLEDWEIVGDSVNNGAGHLVHSSTSEHLYDGQHNADLGIGRSSAVTHPLQLPSTQGRSSDSYSRPQADSSQVQLLSSSDTSTLVAVSPTLGTPGSGLLQCSSELAARLSGAGSDNVMDQKRPEIPPVSSQQPIGSQAKGPVPSISQEVPASELGSQVPGRIVSESVAPGVDSVPPSLSNPSQPSSSGHSLGHSNLLVSSSEANVNMSVLQQPGHNAIHASSLDIQPPTIGIHRLQSENPVPIKQIQDSLASLGISAAATNPPGVVQVWCIFSG